MTRFAACVVAIAGVLAAVAPPARYEIDGLSMAPGLLPGDVVRTGVFPVADRFRRPRRFERWMLTAPDGTPAIKRVIGLPGDTVSIRDGDLAIGGQTVLTPPDLLAQSASPVSEVRIAPTADAAGDGGWQRTVSLPLVYDDAAFAPEERRWLLPLRDVGLAAVIRLPGALTGGRPVQMRVRVDDAVVAWNIEAGGRFALVAGRLDGYLVAAAWPIAASTRWTAEARAAVPPEPPAAWDVAKPWPRKALTEADAAPRRLDLGLGRGGVPLEVDEADAAIEHVTVWRDILWRPAADGQDAWRLGPDDYFVLGDFPSGSRDSRHWGSLPRGALRHRAVFSRPAR